MRLLWVCATVCLVSLGAGSSGCSASDSRALTFTVSSFTVRGELQLPDGNGPHPAIVIVHGDGGGTRRSYRTMRERFLAAGFATFIWDKPGFGESRGQFTSGRVIAERSAILQEALAVLRGQPGIDRTRIGAWGVSQAGYVIPMALEAGEDLAFAILVGAPGEDGVQQTAYFVGRQVRCEGAPETVAAEADGLAARVMSARTYEQYASAGTELLGRFPLVKAIDFMAGVLPEQRWTPRSQNGEAFFDPMTAIGRTSIPMLVLFGELDTNVDPVQGAAAYRAALAKAGNRRSRVTVMPGVDHDMVASETGCLRERRARTSWTPAPQYLNAMTDWLRERREGSGRSVQPASRR